MIWAKRARSAMSCSPTSRPNRLWPVARQLNFETSFRRSPSAKILPALYLPIFLSLFFFFFSALVSFGFVFFSLRLSLLAMMLCSSVDLSCWHYFGSLLPAQGAVHRDTARPPHYCQCDLGGPFHCATLVRHARTVNCQTAKGT